VIGGGTLNHLDLIVNKPPVLDWRVDIETALAEKAMQDVYTGKASPADVGQIMLGLYDYWLGGMINVTQKCMRNYG
jgi:hypothetical protein